MQYKVVLNDEPATIKEDSYGDKSNISIIKGNCIVDIYPRIKAEDADNIKQNFKDYNIVLLVLSKEEYDKFINDYQKIEDDLPNDEFYKNYLFYNTDVIAFGDLANVSNNVVKKVIPYIKIVNPHSCYSLKDKQVAEKHKDFLYSYKSFSGANYKDIVNNPKTANLIPCESVLSSWNDLLNSLKNRFNNIIEMYGVIYKDYQ